MIRSFGQRRTDMASGDAPVSERQSSDAERAELAPDAGEAPSVAARNENEGHASGTSPGHDSCAQQGKLAGEEPGQPAGEAGQDSLDEAREQTGGGEEGGREGGEDEDGGGRGGKEAPGEEREAHTDELGEMPKTIVRRIVKAKLMTVLGKRGLAPEGGGAEANGQQKEVNISKDALVAFAESAKIFVHYVTALAHDWSVQGKRQTITAEDILRGLEDAQLFDFIPQLQDTLEALRASKKTKKSKKTPAGAAKESAPPADTDPAQDSVPGDEAAEAAAQA